MTTISNKEYIQHATNLLFDAPTEVEFRVTKECAKVLLLENFNVGGYNGMRCYINIRDLGLGVCAISKAPINQRETKMIRKQRTKS